MSVDTHNPHRRLFRGKHVAAACVFDLRLPTTGAAVVGGGASAGRGRWRRRDHNRPAGSAQALYLDPGLDAAPSACVQRLDVQGVGVDFRRQSKAPATATLADPRDADADPDVALLNDGSPNSPGGPPGVDPHDCTSLHGQDWPPLPRRRLGYATAAPSQAVGLDPRRDGLSAALHAGRRRALDAPALGARSHNDAHGQSQGE